MAEYRKFLFSAVRFPFTGTLYTFTDASACTTSVGVNPAGQFFALSNAIPELFTVQGVLPAVPPAVVIYPCRVVQYLGLARECHRLATDGNSNRRFLTYQGRQLAQWYAQRQPQAERILARASRAA